MSSDSTYSHNTDSSEDEDSTKNKKPTIISDSDSDNDTNNKKSQAANSSDSESDSDSSAQKLHGNNPQLPPQSKTASATKKSSDSEDDSDRKNKHSDSEDDSDNKNKSPDSEDDSEKQKGKTENKSANVKASSESDSDKKKDSSESESDNKDSESEKESEKQKNNQKSDTESDDSEKETKQSVTTRQATVTPNDESEESSESQAKSNSEDESEDDDADQKAVFEALSKVYEPILESKNSMAKKASEALEKEIKDPSDPLSVDLGYVQTFATTFWNNIESAAKGIVQQIEERTQDLNDLNTKISTISSNFSKARNEALTGALEKIRADFPTPPANEMPNLHVDELGIVPSSLYVLPLNSVMRTDTFRKSVPNQLVIEINNEEENKDDLNLNLKYYAFNQLDFFSPPEDKKGTKDPFIDSSDKKLLDKVMPGITDEAKPSVDKDIVIFQQIEEEEPESEKDDLSHRSETSSRRKDSEHSGRKELDVEIEEEEEDKGEEPEEKEEEKKK